MKILDRYIFKELLQVFLLGLTVLVAILILEKISFLSEAIFNKGVTVGELFRLILYISPAFLMVSIPLAILLASLVAFSRLSADNEITAMRAGGVGFYRILLPVLALSVMAWAVSTHLAVNVQHLGNLKFIESLTSIISKQADVALGERLFFDRFPGTVVYINERPAGSNALKGIFISDSRNPEERRIITAKSGTVKSVGSNIVFSLHKGSIYSDSGGSYRLIEYEEYDLVFDIGSSKSGSYVLQPREMSIAQIKKLIAEREAEQKTAFSEKVEIYKRYSLPFSCVVFGLLGAPLGMRVQRGGRWGGMGIGIALLIASYLLFMLGEGLGKEGTISPLLAMWFPNILMGIIAAFLIYATSRETAPFKITLWVQSKWLDIVGQIEGRKSASSKSFAETPAIGDASSTITALSWSDEPEATESPAVEPLEPPKRQIELPAIEETAEDEKKFSPYDKNKWKKGVLEKNGKFYSPCMEESTAWIGAFSHSRNCESCKKIMKASG